MKPAKWKPDGGMAFGVGGVGESVAKIGAIFHLLLPVTPNSSEESHSKTTGKGTDCPQNRYGFAYRTLNRMF